MSGWLILGILLRVLGILVLVLVVLIAVLLWMPVGFDFDWRPGRFVLRADAGPLRLILYPFSEMHFKPSFLRRRRPKKPRKKTAAPSRVPPKEPESAPPQSPPPVKEQAPASPSDASSAPVPPNTEPGVPNQTDSSPKPDTTSAPRDEGTSGTQIVQEMLGVATGPMGQMLNQVAQDPRAFLEQNLEPLLETGNWLLSKVRVRHLRVDWTVTGQDAADTAIRYGREIAFWNTLLALAQDKLDLKADGLRLEPDFTGQLAKNRHLACQITVRMYIIVAIGLRMVRGKPIRPKEKTKTSKQGG